MMARSLFALAALAFGAAAATSAVSEIRARPLVQLSRAVEGTGAGIVLDEQAEARLMATLRWDDDCRESTARSKVTAAIFLFRQAVRSGQPDQEILDRMTTASRMATHALACSPLDGNRWYLAGRLRPELITDERVLEPFLVASIEKAPFEGAVMAARWSYIAPLITRLDYWRLEPVTRDFDNLLAIGDVTLVRDVIETLRRVGSDVQVDAALARLPDPRRLMIEPVDPRSRRKRLSAADIWIDISISRAGLDHHLEPPDDRESL